MPVEIIDLDKLVGDDKLVTLAGQQYRLPPDMPVELYLRINRYANEDLSDPQMVESLYQEVLGLFRYGDPDIESLPLSMSQLVQAIGRIYGEDDGDVDANPTSPKRTRGGSSKTASRNGSKSRSRR